MSSLDIFLKSPSPNTTVKASEEDIKALKESSVSDATQINRHLDSKFTGLSENMDRQISAIEDIAQSAQKQAISSETLATLAKSQADKAMDKSLSAVLRSNKAFIISVIGVLISLFANADKLVHNVQKILSYLSSLL
ncbi:hypothetical protein [Lacrimispora sp.]|uniref:hypothetical protein n=1 Tax=Lacrimispora sp. TaxID=2719234 RepID=UPI0028A0B8E8|nr:hypothetical protein [Lacrimispora sp.]